mgnify:CR=1 FL=1
MKKVHLKEEGIKNFIRYSMKESLPSTPLLNDESDDEYDDYEDDTYYSVWNYKDEIEAYLKQVASVGNGYVEEDDGQYYIDFDDLQVLFRLDDKQGILFIEKFEMYSRLELEEANKIDDIMVKVIQFVHQHPLNVSQQMQ